jgi:probable HAF family extracellular repeat protein
MITISTFKIRIFVQAAALGAALGFLSPAFAGIVGTRAYLIDLNSKEIRDLGTLGGTNTIPSAINDAGQVVGGSEILPYFENNTWVSGSHAFVTGPNGTGITDLGAGWAYGINDIGQVTGIRMGRTFITGPNGIGVTELGTPLDDAFGINNAGQVAGTSVTAVEGQSRAFITGPNGVGMKDLGTMGGISSYGSGVNDAAQVVGTFVTADGLSHAFVTGPDGVGMADLGTLSGINSGASAINNAGQIVGTFLTAEHQAHAFFADPNSNRFTDLGTLGGISSFARGINDAGQVVGSFHISPGVNHAFITGPDGVGITDLNLLIPHPQPVFLWTQAVGINNHGQVVVEASIVPEPETYALLLAGLVLIGIMGGASFAGASQRQQYKG